MARRKYTIGEREALLMHYMEQCGMHYEGEGKSLRLVERANTPAYGRAHVKVFAEKAELHYSLPIPDIAQCRAELLERINDLNAVYHRDMVFYVTREGFVWTICIEGSVPYHGCSRQYARRAASELFWLLGMVHVCVEGLMEALPDLLTDESLRKAEEDASWEPREEDFADPLDYADALLEHYYSDAEPSPSFEMPPENPAEEASPPEWPEEFGDEEAFLTENGEKALSELSGSELIKMHIALSRSLSRKKKRFDELRDALSRCNINNN